MQAINIVFGSVFGSAHYVATELKKAFEQKSYSAHLLEQPMLTQLDTAAPLVVVSSTTGDGELPERLRPLLLALQQPDANISGLKYAVIALGDSNYTNYCGGARALSTALEQAGATALAPALELDACRCLNPEDEALPWALKLIEDNR